MSKKNKIIMFLIIALAMITIIWPDEGRGVISAIGAVGLVVIMRGSDCIIRRNLIKKIERENIEHIKVKENNKWEILLMIIVALNTYTMIKSRYDLFVTQSNGSSINISSYINSLDTFEKAAQIACFALVILGIFASVQVLLSQCIVSRDKVIFYDGLVFDICEIEDIEYLESYSKKYKKIKLGKGFIDRKIITTVDEFDTVKNILENKNS